jgi:small subunit ribosomal protein S1
MIKTFKKTAVFNTDNFLPPKLGEMVKGFYVAQEKGALFLDLGAKGIGIIEGNDFAVAKSSLKELKKGDTVTAKIISLETDEGYRGLSMLQANQDIAWKKLLEKRETEEILELPVKSANKGGLIIQIDNISGFLPASQLSKEHYPKVENADPAKIVQELQKLIGQTIKVKILDVNPNEKKLIFSEKISEPKEISPQEADLQEGQVIKGEISGVTGFGAFIKIKEGLEGLITQENIPEEKSASLKIGEKVEAKITQISNNKIYLSLKNV